MTDYSKLTNDVQQNIQKYFDEHAAFAKGQKPQVTVQVEGAQAKPTIDIKIPDNFSGDRKTAQIIVENFLTNVQVRLGVKYPLEGREYLDQPYPNPNIPPSKLAEGGQSLSINHEPEVFEKIADAVDRALVKCRETDNVIDEALTGMNDYLNNALPVPEPRGSETFKPRVEFGYDVEGKHPSNIKFQLNFLPRSHPNYEQEQSACNGLLRAMGEKFKEGDVHTGSVHGNPERTCTSFNQNGIMEAGQAIRKAVEGLKQKPVTDLGGHTTSEAGGPGRDRNRS